jgi:hypothetical protein
VFTHTSPGPPPAAGCLLEAEVEDEPEDFELLLDEAGVLAAGAAAAAAAAGAGAVAGAAAGLEEDVEELPASLFTPPCPRQAPRPPWAAVVPSLQVTGALEEDEEDEELEDVPDEAAVLEPEAGAAEPEEPLAAALAVLSTPPWPLQAPRPLCVAVEPSLQTGLGAVLLLELVLVLPLVLCASDSAGAASSAAANTAPHVKRLKFASFIWRTPLGKAVVLNDQNTVIAMSTVSVAVYANALKLNEG